MEAQYLYAIKPDDFALSKSNNLCDTLILNVKDIGKYELCCYWPMSGGRPEWSAIVYPDKIEADEPFIIEYLESEGNTKLDALKAVNKHYEANKK